MKALNQIELENLANYLRNLLQGAQLQEVLANDRGLALGFQGQSRYWLILDLIPATPFMVVFENHCPFKKSPKTKPIALFLKSHGVNLQVKKLEVQVEFGRVVRLELVGREQKDFCELEIRLIPKQCNLIVHADGKSIAWDKPLPLTAPPDFEVPEPRSLLVIHEEWLENQKIDKKPSKDPVAQFEKQKMKDLEKKRRALEDLKKQLENQEAVIWSQVGEELKNSRNLKVSAEFTKYIKSKESVSWNIENCFAKSKQLESKKLGARQRLVILEQEISKLELKKYTESTHKNQLVDLMQKIQVRGRKLHLPSGAIAYCGRSASDNLSLLRQAKAWDYWLHLRDYPGAHAILHRQRNQSVTEQELQQVAEWVAKESLASKTIQEGVKIAVVYVECRFVRPIKGDKLGRVNYHSASTLSFTLRHR